MNHLFLVVLSDIDYAKVIEAESMLDAIWNEKYHGDVMFALQLPDDAVQKIKEWKDGEGDADDGISVNAHI